MTQQNCLVLIHTEKMERIKKKNTKNIWQNCYVLKAKSKTPTKTDRIRANSAAIMLTLLDFSSCFPATVLFSSLQLFKDDGLRSGDNGITVSQKELLDKFKDSVSGSKIIDASVGASIDINSTQWSLRT